MRLQKKLWYIKLQAEIPNLLTDDKHRNLLLSPKRECLVLSNDIDNNYIYSLKQQTILSVHWTPKLLINDVDTLLLHNNLRAKQAVNLHHLIFFWIVV